MKTCTLCNQPKELECFSINKRNKTDGRQLKCKECNSKYYKANQDKVKKRVNDQYHANNKEILERRAELRLRPEAKVKKAAQDADYYRKNKKYIQEY